MTQTTRAAATSIDEWRRQGTDRVAALGSLENHIALQEPHVQALVDEPDRFERLRRQMDSCPEGQLTGVPVGIKDIFQVAGLDTRAGSRLPPEELGGAEAACITAMKQEGALVLGKTVSTEFAYFVPGPTRNPWNLAHTPGGSSSGSAAAVAAGYCPVALGTQTIGSICRPAAFCGVVGFKPSYGRVSTSGVLPLSPSLDHVGIFTSNIADATCIAEVIVDDWRSPARQPRPTLGIPEGPYLQRASDEGLRHFERLVDRLRADQWQIRVATLFEDFAEIEARHHLVVAAEAARAHRRWFDAFGDLYNPKTRELVERGATVSDEVLADCLAELPRLRTRIEGLMRGSEIDLWIAPAATGPAPRGIESTGDPVMNLPWTQAGLPAISLPAGTSEQGLPLGLQVVGRYSGDESLLEASSLLESSLRRSR